MVRDSRLIFAYHTDDFSLGDGLVNFNEFKLMMNHKGENRLNIFNDELLNEAFRIFDKEGNGFITEKGLRAVMNNLGKITVDSVSLWCFEFVI